MKKFLCSIFILLLVSSKLLAQQQHIWIWGNRAGLNFNTNPPTAFNFNNQTPSIAAFNFSIEASTTVCDVNGQLLFYTDGSYVLDNQENIMTNGDNLTGIAPTTQTPNATSSTAQGCQIIPVPGNPNKYFIFSMTAFETGVMGRLYYSVVDMSLNNGLGDVVAGQKGIFIDEGHSEQMAAVAYCGDYWLITIARNAGQIRAYKVGAAGVSQPVITPLLPNSTGTSPAGYISISPDGHKIAIVSGAVNGLSLFDFDGLSGALLNQQIIDQSLSYLNLGLCFSPDNSKLYVNGSNNHIYQYDLSSGIASNIANSKTSVFASTTSFNAHLKRGPNGKIYFSGHPFSMQNPNLSTIDNPNALGAACQININSVTLAANSYHILGLPAEIPKYQSGLGNLSYGSVNACKGDTTAFAWVSQPNTDTSSYSITWMDMNYNVLQYVASSNQGDTLKHLVPGVYFADIENADGCKLRLNILVETPVYDAYFEVDTLVCVNSNVNFNPNFTNNDFEVWQWDFGNGNSSTLQVPSLQYSNAGVYTIQFIGTTAKGCKDTFEQSIIVDTIMTPEFELDDDAICAGEQINVKALFGNHVRYALWNFGDGGTLQSVDTILQYAYPNPGVYDINMNVAYRACPNVIFSRSVTVHDYPKVDLGTDTGLCYQGTAILLKNSAANEINDHLQWNTGATSESIYANHHGVYSLTVTRNDCSTTDSVTIHKDCYIDIPNAFAPGSGDASGYFLPRSILSKGVSQFQMLIYNRWGQLVFQTQNIDGRGWDGNFNGQAQAQGVYVYQIDVVYKDGKSEKYQGNVTLLR